MGEGRAYGGNGNDWLLAEGGLVELHGEAGDDTLSGLWTTGARLYGGDGNDRITTSLFDGYAFGGAGDDTIIGGEGWDTLLLSGARNDYRYLRSGDDWIVNGPDGTDRVTGVELLRFSDGTVVDLARQVGSSPGAKASADAFVLPALPDDPPLVLPGLEPFKADGQPQVLPGVQETAPLFLAFEARVALSGDWMLTVDGELEPRHGDWMG